MQNFKYKLLQFFSQRYGNDFLNLFLFWLSLFFIILNTFLLDSTFLFLLIQLILIFAVFRSLSKNYSQRQHENNIFLQITKHARHYYSCFKRQSADPKNKYFVCPYCAQITRIPKGRGQVEILCPKCKKKFDKRS